jgi:molybdate transport system regulatory protein
MELSARNQLPGTVTAITRGAVMAEVSVDIGGGRTIVAAVTASSIDRLSITEGAAVVVVIKATDVMVAMPTT